METTKHYPLIPTAGGSFSYAWGKIFGNAFLMLLVAVIITGLFNGPNAGFNWKFDHHFPLSGLFVMPFVLFGLAYGFLFLPVIKFGEKYIFLKAMRGEEADLKLLFEGFRTQYLNIVLANLIVTALVMIGVVMLIIPGIIIACRLAFVPYLVMDKNLEAMKAVEKSWQMTRGYGWTIFGMAIISFFVFIAGVIVFIVGALVSIMWIHGAFASLYYAIAGDNEDDNPIPILGVNEV